MSKFIPLVVEGIIACGKSTTLYEISLLNKQVATLYEPVHRFSQYKQFNPLRLAYKDPYKYSSITQVHIIREMNEYFSKYMSATSNQIWVTERCLSSSIPFINAQYSMNYISKFEQTLLTDMALEKANEYTVDKYFFITCPPEISIERIQIRNRREESHMSPPFIYALHTAYHNYMLEIIAEKGRHSVYLASHNSNNLAQLALSFLKQNTQ